MSIVLRGWLGTGDISNERFSVTFQHHKSMKTLRESKVVVGCSICIALTDELERREELDVTEDTQIAIQAELTRLEDHDNLAFRRGSKDPVIFRLDFTLEKEQLGPRMEMKKVETHLRTFALKPTSTSIPHFLNIYALLLPISSLLVSSVALLSTLSRFLYNECAIPFASFKGSFYSPFL
jgi:hypothetical protein